MIMILYILGQNMASRVSKQSEQPLALHAAAWQPCQSANSIICLCVCVVLCLYVLARVVSMWFVLARVYKAATAACIPLGLTWNAILQLARTSHTVTRSVRLRERRDFEFIAHIAI